MTFQIKFSRGAVAQGMVTQAASGFFHNLDIYGRQGRISLRGVGFTCGIDVVSSALPAYSQPTSIQLPQIEDLRILMHRPQLAEFAQAIRERRQPSCTVTDGGACSKCSTRSQNRIAPARRFGLAEASSRSSSGYRRRSRLLS